MLPLQCASMNLWECVEVSKGFFRIRITPPFTFSILPRCTYIREVNFVASFIKHFNQDVIYSARFENPAVSWMNFKT